MAPSIGYSRTREGDALMEKRLRETVELAKQARIIKYTEAQTIQTEQYETPEPPSNPSEAEAMNLLIVRGPILKPSMDAVFEALVVAGKATRTLAQDGFLYALKQKVTKKDSPLKGKKVTFTKPPKIDKVVRDDGLEEWTYTLVGDEEMI